ncbi:TPA: hypothetical protein ACRRWQ_000750 [Morganella morganii]
MAKNEFLPFGTAEGANVLSSQEYEALAARHNGFTSGVAKSKELNKVWRQASLIASAVAQFIVDTDQKDLLDTGDFSDIKARLSSAINLIISNGDYVTNPYLKLELLKKIDKADITQQLGNDTSKVASQDLLTTELGKKAGVAEVNGKLDKSKVTNSLVNSRELVPTTALLIDNLELKQPAGDYQEAGFSYSKYDSDSRYQGKGDGIGYGQKWKDVKNERAVRTNYTNDLAKPISIFVRLGESESQGVGIIIDGVTAALFTAAGPNVSQGATAIVPPGSRYYVYAPSGKENIFEWTELR